MEAAEKNSGECVFVLPEQSPLLCCYISTPTVKLDIDLQEFMTGPPNKTHSPSWATYDLVNDQASETMPRLFVDQHGVPVLLWVPQLFTSRAHVCFHSFIVYMY